MPAFSKKSKSLLEQCHPDLQKVFNQAIKYIDFTILDSTIRTKEQQTEYVKTGKSKTMNSKHLKRYCKEFGGDCSFAIDVMPYFASTPHTDWNDREEFALLAGIVLGIAKVYKDLGIIKSDITWGGKWSANRIKENKFVDMPHFEVK